MKENEQKRVLITELDCAKECELTYKIAERDVILDIKSIMSDYYVATFLEVGNVMKIAFNNGQSFTLQINENA